MHSDVTTTVDQFSILKSNFYNGDGLRRTLFEAGGVLTTEIWDGTDYLGEY